MTLSHSPFPIFPIDWIHEGRLAFFFLSLPFLRYPPHVMFWKYSNKENVAGHALSTGLILNNAEACCACGGKTGNSGLFFYFLSWASWQLRAFHCQWLLIRPVTGGLYVPFFYIWLLYDEQLTCLLANYRLWKDSENYRICFFCFSRTQIRHLECFANDFITQKPLCLFLWHKTFLAADSSIVDKSRFHS